MKVKGFTLIEMVVSMIIIGIISLGLINFGVISSSLFVENKYRLHALEEARFVLARFGRELANTVPLSSRMLDDGRCMEYIPLLYVGEFLPEQVELDITKSDAAFPMAYPVKNQLANCFIDPASPCFVSIYPTASADLYQGANDEKQIYTLKSAEAQSLTIAETLSRLPLTPSNRLFVYQPFARQFCVENKQLRYYPSYPISFAGLGQYNGQPSVKFAQGVNETQNVFSLGFNGTYSSTANLRFSLNINQGKEAVEFMQNAQILNSQ